MAGWEDLANCWWVKSEFILRGSQGLCETMKKVVFYILNNNKITLFTPLYQFSKLVKFQSSPERLNDNNYSSLDFKPITSKSLKLFYMARYVVEWVTSSPLSRKLLHFCSIFLISVSVKIVVIFPVCFTSFHFTILQS